jgi:serine/threonine protein phosphatase PrpC
MRVSLKLKVVGKTDKGLVRPANEDFLHLDNENRVFAVCDGMGGHQAGEVASMMAAETLLQVFAYHHEGILADPLLKLDRTFPATGDLLVKGIRLANRAINSRAYAQKTLAGMGTTIVAVAFESDLMSVAHVGDSRAYKLTQTSLEPLTVDHSWVTEVQLAKGISREEAAAYVGKNVITRALGVRENVEVDYRLYRIAVGDIFILCSDGLCGYVEDEEIFKVAYDRRANIEGIVDGLIQLAHSQGGPDNITVVAIEVLEVASSQLPEVEPSTISFEAVAVQQAEDRWIQKMQSEEVPPPQEKKKNSPTDPESAPPNRHLLIGLFVVFAVVAVLIIYLAQSK